MEWIFVFDSPSRQVINLRPQNLEKLINGGGAWKKNRGLEKISKTNNWGGGRSFGTRAIESTYRK